MPEDAIFTMLESKEGDLGDLMGKRVEGVQKFPVFKEDRKPRTDEEMGTEAKWLEGFLDEEVHAMEKGGKSSL